MIATPARTTTSGDMLDMLRRHYLPEGRLPGGIFATEIQSPDGSRRADALWCPWSSISSGLIGHEVKVSRTDLVVELLDPMKSDPWARFCEAWWGVMAPPSGRRTRSMTIVRPAPRLKPQDTGVAWRRIAAHAEYRHVDRVREAESKAAMATSKAEYAERQLLDRQLAEQGRVDGRAAKIGRILTELDSRRWHGSLVDADVDAIVAAIVDLEEHRRLARRTRDEIRWMAEEARRMASPAARIADDLERLAKAAQP